MHSRQLHSPQPPPAHDDACWLRRIRGQVPWPLQMAPTREITWRSFEPRDGEAIVQAFNRVFASVQAGFCERTLGGWRWRFVDNPAGGRVSLAVDSDGQVLAQYAGLGLRMRLDGQDSFVSQSVDSFCDPKVRGGLARAGLFVETGRDYAKRYGLGPGGNQVETQVGRGSASPEGIRGAGQAPACEGTDAFMFGLPVPSAWRTGRDHLGYQLFSSMWRLVVPGNHLLAAPECDSLALTRGTRPPRGADALFESWATGRPAVVVKDNAYLRWRYEECPEQDYTFLAVHRLGQLVGWTVVVAGELEGCQALWLMDWGMYGQDGRVLAALLKGAGQLAGEQGLGCVATLVGDAFDGWGVWQAAGMRVEPSRYFLVGRSYDRRRPVAWWADHFSPSLGDTDLL